MISNAYLLSNNKQACELFPQKSSQVSKSTQVQTNQIIPCKRGFVGIRPNCIHQAQLARSLDLHRKFCYRLTNTPHRHIGKERTFTQIHLHTHTLTLTLIITLKHIHTSHTFTHSRIHLHIYTHTHKHYHKHSHSYTRILTHSYTLVLTHSHIHIQTHNIKACLPT